MPWWLNFLLSMAIVAPLSIGSWHLVEKHAARFRGTLFAFEKRYVEQLADVIGWFKTDDPQVPASGASISVREESDV